MATPVSEFQFSSVPASVSPPGSGVASPRLEWSNLGHGNHSMGSTYFTGSAVLLQPPGQPGASSPTSYSSSGTGGMFVSHRNTSPLSASSVPAQVSAYHQNAIPPNSPHLLTIQPDSFSTAAIHSQPVRDIFEACPPAPLTHAGLGSLPTQSQAAQVAHCSPAFHLSDRGQVGNNGK